MTRMLLREFYQDCWVIKNRVQLHHGQKTRHRHSKLEHWLQSIGELLLPSAKLGAMRAQYREDLFGIDRFGITTEPMVLGDGRCADFALAYALMASTSYVLY